MKKLVFLALLVGCTSGPNPKYFAQQKVTFEWSGEGLFWSKACKNVGTIKKYRHDANGDVVYIIHVECTGWDGSLYTEFQLYESRITGEAGYDL